MTREEIIDMAREAGLSITPPRSGQYDGGRVGCDVVGLTKFAALVAAKEREACAKLVDDMSLEDLPDEPTEDGILQICTGVVWATRIRARGQQ